MPRFDIRYTGDYLDETGKVGVGDIALDLYEGSPFIAYDFLRDQSPAPGDAGYWDRLYSLEIEPHHVAEVAVHVLVVLGPGALARRAPGRDALDLLDRA